MKRQFVVVSWTYTHREATDVRTRAFSTKHEAEQFAETIPPGRDWRIDEEELSRKPARAEDRP